MDEFVQVRPARPEDIEAIQRLETEAFGHTWDRATFLKELERANGVTVVAERERSVVGAALLVWAAKEAQLNSIVLSPEVRGRGYSRDFLGRLMEHCRQRKLHWLTLEVKWHNAPALALYRRFGFVTTARRKGYYSDGTDARLMWAGHLQSPGFSRLLQPYSERAWATGP